MLNEMKVAVGDVDSSWKDAESRFLRAVPTSMRAIARSLLDNPRRGGRGLRALLDALAGQQRFLPDALPINLVAVYLEDAEAEPLHDCEECGLLVPVRVGRRCGHEPTAERIYFPLCPHCGGRTGRHAYWSGSAKRNRLVSAVAEN